MFDKLKLKRKICKLKREVNNGNSQAMYDLAKIYLDTSLIATDKEEALVLMQKSASLGNIQAKAYITTNKISKGIDIAIKAINDIKKLK